MATYTSILKGSKIDKAVSQFDDNGFLLNEDGAIAWEDLRFPLTGRNLDVASGRIDYDYFNGTVVFEDNARFALTETISFLVQLPHAWKEASGLRPHLHWLQQGTNVPNWLIGWKWYPKGAATVISTDFTGHTLSARADSGAFAYTSGVIHQITRFDDIVTTGRTISDCLHVCLWRDSNNASTEFAGADPSLLDEHAIEFDIHYQVNTNGSRQEFVK